jgi:hypothetical protein
MTQRAQKLGLEKRSLTFCRCFSPFFGEKLFVILIAIVTASVNRKPG